MLSSKLLTGAVAIVAGLVGAGLLSAAPAASKISLEATTETTLSFLTPSFLMADNHMGAEPTDGMVNDTIDDTVDSTMDNTMDDTMMDDTMDDTTAASTIVEVASNSESFNTLVTALDAAGLASTLSGQGPYTVFAPTDEAFAELPAGALEFLLQPENEDILAEVLTYHVVPGEITADELSTGGISALGGGIAVAVSDSGVIINNGSVTQPNIQASNGVIHQINRVLIPTSVKQQLLASLGVNSLYE